jgi:hypothetical protein
MCESMNPKLFIVATTMIVFGCASQAMIPVAVISTPPGAQVDVNGISMGTPPAQLSLSCPKRWVGVANAPDGWAYDGSIFEITVYPSSGNPGYSQTKRINPCQWAGSGALEVKFDLGLERVAPTQKLQLE